MQQYKASMKKNCKDEEDWTPLICVDEELSHEGEDYVVEDSENSFEYIEHENTKDKEEKEPLLENYS